MTDLATAAAERASFIMSHGGNPIAAGDNLLLPSGAKIVNTGYGEMFLGPPLDQAELRDRRKRYAIARLRLVEKDFTALRAALRGYGQFTWPADGRYGPGPADGLDALKHLQRLTIEAQDAVASFDEEDAIGGAREQQRHAIREQWAKLRSHRTALLATGQSAKSALQIEI